MFDIGFGELLIIAIVALVVLGPEKLPKAARFAGLWVRRGRAQWASVKAELERDLAAEELRKSMQDTRDAMRGVGDSINKADADIRRELGDVQQSLASPKQARSVAAAERDPATEQDTDADTMGAGHDEHHHKPLQWEPDDADMVTHPHDDEASSHEELARSSASGLETEDDFNPRQATLPLSASAKARHRPRNTDEDDGIG